MIFWLFFSFSCFYSLFFFALVPFLQQSNEKTIVRSVYNFYLLLLFLLCLALLIFFSLKNKKSSEECKQQHLSHDSSFLEVTPPE